MMNWFAMTIFGTLVIVIIPHSMSCGGYNVFDHLSVIIPFFFFCQRNSYETIQQNFMKLCSYAGHTVLMGIFAGKI